MGRVTRRSFLRNLLNAVVAAPTAAMITDKLVEDALQPAEAKSEFGISTDGNLGVGTGEYESLDLVGGELQNFRLDASSKIVLDGNGLTIYGGSAMAMDAWMMQRYGACYVGRDYLDGTNEPE